MSKIILSKNTECAVLRRLVHYGYPEFEQDFFIGKYCYRVIERTLYNGTSDCSTQKLFVYRTLSHLHRTSCFSDLWDLVMEKEVLA